MTIRNVIEVLAIALLGAIFLIIASAHAQKTDQLVKPPIWYGGKPMYPVEPAYKPAPLTPERVKRLRELQLLPPEEFDGKYKGELKIVRGTQAQLRLWCPGAFNPGWNAIGCTREPLPGFPCVVYILNDQGLQAIPYDYEVAYRHELAHCAGWFHERPR
jgi:hypothetical protein